MEQNDLDAADLTHCAAIKVDTLLQPQDIAVSHRFGKAATGKHRQVLVKFSTCNTREKVFKTKKNIKTGRENNTSLINVYINADLNQFRAKARISKKKMPLFLIPGQFIHNYG